ncbi:MAG TPA: DUF3039 domain-containing protein [Jatrophihabitantaceae bacterium]|jgi:hypothetical protein
MAQSATVQTDVKEKPAPSNSDTDEGDDLFHYVPKAKIVESAVTGALVQAICGAVFPVTKAPKPGSPVCPRCKELYDARA